jgi:hypothetical protein
MVREKWGRLLKSVLSKGKKGNADETSNSWLYGFLYNQLQRYKIEGTMEKNRKGGFEAIQFNSVYSIVGHGLVRGYVYGAGKMR